MGRAIAPTLARRLRALDDASPLDERVRQWRGSSRGYWEGETLVVETTNFSARSDFRGAAQGLRLVERFRRVGPDTIEYAFTVTDPATWTAPWTVTYPMTRTGQPVYEYACHEGNHGLRNILNAARVGQ